MAAWTRWLPLACLLALVVTACGSGGPSTQSAPDYREQVDRLLLDVHDRWQLDPGIQLGTLEPKLRAGLSAYADADRELRDLRPPAQLAAIHRQLLARVAAVRAALRRGAADARGRRTRAVLTDLGQLAAAENRVAALVERLHRLAA